MWLQLERTRVLDGSAIAKAINYSLNHWARLGQYLLMDGLHRIWRRAIEIAAMAVVVDAKDEAAAAFYQPFAFTPLQRDPRRLYLSMKKVAALFR